MTARQKAQRKLEEERWKKMTPAQKKRASTMSKPAKVPVNKKKIRSAGESLRKAVGKIKKK